MPSRSLAGRHLHRVLRASRRSPWWFSSDADDPDAARRFDLLGPEGACYLSTTALGAVLELGDLTGRVFSNLTQQCASTHTDGQWLIKHNVRHSGSAVKR